MTAAAAPIAINRATVVLALGDLPTLTDRSFWSEQLTAAELAACLTRRHAKGHAAARLAGRHAVQTVLGDATVGAAFDSAPGTRPHLTSEGGVAVSLSHTAHHAGAMAVLGGAVRACGCDLLDLRRWHVAMRRTGEALVARVTASIERATDAAVGMESARLAGMRFSVKESVIKAVGGLCPGGGFHDIEVTFMGDATRPHVRLRGAVAARARVHNATAVVGEVTALSDDLLQSAVVLSTEW